MPMKMAQDPLHIEDRVSMASVANRRSYSKQVVWRHDVDPTSDHSIGEVVVVMVTVKVAAAMAVEGMGLAGAGILPVEASEREGVRAIDLLPVGRRIGRRIGRRMSAVAVVALETVETAVVAKE